MFSIDLKSSNEVTQSIIENWIKKNQNYETKSWETDILSKRVIAWISNSKIVLEAGADILVSGTTIFKENDGNIKTNIEKLKSM